MKKIFSLILLISGFVFSNSYSQQDLNGWYWLNGKPTGNNLNWVYITSSGSHYALGGKGTFAKSTDGGTQWSINSRVGIPDASLSYRDLKTGFFLDDNTGFAAGSTTINNVQGVVSKTTDGGNNWVNYQYNDTSGSVNGMHFINSNTGFICGGTRARVHKTTDGGLTWSDISAGLSATNTYNAVYAIDENKIFLAFSTRRLYYTSNGGANWSLMTLPGTTGGGTMTDVYFKDANTGFACGSTNYFAYTSNGGTNWTQNNPSFPSTSGLKDITFNDNKLYVLGSSKGYIYKSLDDGVTWDSVFFYDNTNVNQPASPSYNYLSINGSNMAVVGANGHVTVSSNSGSNWTNKNYSVNSGSNSYNSITMKSPSDIWLTSTGGIGSLLHTTNAGVNWTAIPSAHNVAIFQMDFPTTDTAFSCAGNIPGSIGQIAKSVNGGLNWSLLSNPNLNETYITLDFLNGSTGYVGTSPANVYKTTNGGATWITQNTAGNGAILSVQMIDVNSGYALSSVLRKTTNGGTNWVTITIPAGTWSNMNVLDMDVLYINGATAISNGNPLIYKSTDAGGSWTNVSGDLPDSVTVNRTKWLNLNDGIAGCSGGLLAKTSNGGVNWVVSNPGIQSITDVAFSNKNLWYAVSNSGGNYPIVRNIDVITSIGVNINVGIEGFWNGSVQVSDTVKAELRSLIFPYNIVDVSKTVITSGTGFGAFEFLTAPAGTYYISIKHRNSIETWSATPILMSAGGNYNYSFTSSATKAYGSNTVLKLGRYCNYSGDVNQDGTIDADDLSQIENDVTTSLTGYVTSDLTGDNAVDAGDLSLVENNSTLGVNAIVP